MSVLQFIDDSVNRLAEKEEFDKGSPGWHITRL